MMMSTILVFVVAVSLAEVPDACDYVHAVGESKLDVQVKLYEKDNSVWAKVTLTNSENYLMRIDTNWAVPVNGVAKQGGFEVRRLHGNKPVYEVRPHIDRFTENATQTKMSTDDEQEIFLSKGQSLVWEYSLSASYRLDSVGLYEAKYFVSMTELNQCRRVTPYSEPITFEVKESMLRREK